MAWGFVQSNITVTSDATSTTCAFDSNVTAGNTLFVSISANNDNGTGTINTPTDTLGHTYVPMVNQQDIGVGFGLLRTFYVENCTGGANTVTGSLNGGEATADITVVVSEFSGGATSNSLDQTNSNVNTSAAPSTGNVTPTQNNELLYATMTHWGADQTITPEIGWSQAEENQGGNTSMPISVTYKIQTTATTEDADWSTGGNQEWAAHVGSFKVAAVVSIPRRTLLGVGL